MMSGKRLITAFVLCVMLGSAPSAMACPNCKEAVAAQTGDGARLKNGYYYSIIFMIAMPFTMLGTGAFMVARAVKRGALPEM